MQSENQDQWFVLANPLAGNGAVRSRLSSIITTLKNNGFKITLAKTTHKAHALDLVQQAIEKGFRKIIGIGGDGTNNEIINGICLQSVIRSADITYVLFPIGTGNDWIKEYRIPTNLDAWIAMVKNGKTGLQDIGIVSFYKNGKQQKRYFTNVAGMAYDAFVLAEMEKLERPITNRLVYLIYGLYYVFKYKLQKAKIQFNGKVVNDYFYLINVGICKYSGGGMQLVPHAIPNDGKLALTLAGKLTKIGVLLNSYRFYNTSIGEHPKVDTFQTEHIKVEAIDEPIMIEVDGELVGETPVEFTILKAALKIITP